MSLRYIPMLRVNFNLSQLFVDTLSGYKVLGLSSACVQGYPIAFTCLGT